MLRRRARAAWLLALYGLLVVVSILGVPWGRLAFAEEAPSAEHPADEPAEVHLHDRAVFVVRLPRGEQSASQRARSASQVLDGALDEQADEPPETRVEETRDTATVFVGKVPLIVLGPDDARAAGDESLHVHAAHVAGQVRDTIRSEFRRRAIATAVFAFSLLVFSGLVTFLLLRRTSDLAQKARHYIHRRAGGLGAVRLGQIEVLSRATVRGAVAVSLTLGHRILQLAVVYGWLIFALSLFSATRGYTKRLTGYVFEPLSALASRAGAALPVLVVAAIAIVAVSILVRFIGLFFEAVERGETRLDWLPPDLVRPTSWLLRIGVIVAALVLGSPLVTGAEDGALARTSLVILLALGVASVPVAASAAAGVAVVFGRRLRVGDVVDVGGHVGKVKETTLLEVLLEDADGSQLRVPHLLTLVRPTYVLGSAPTINIDLVVDPIASQVEVHTALLEAARTIAPSARVRLVMLDREGAHYRVCAPDEDPSGARLLAAVTGAIAAKGISLGAARGQREGRPSDAARPAT